MADIYTNQLPVSTDTDGSVYNVVGYMEGYRLNSSGSVVEYAGTNYTMSVTGFIPVQAGDVIRIKNAVIDPDDTNAGSVNMKFYDSDKNVMSGGGSWSAILNAPCSTCQSYVADDDGNVIEFTLPTGTTYDGVLAYIRLTLGDVTGASVITVNEEITEAAVTGECLDSLDINVDFTDYNGEFVAYFCGHAHNDYHYKASSFLIDMITIACDGRVSNCTYMSDETYGNRALGTVYEQCVDVVGINYDTRTIKTVRIGSGENREISY